MIFYIKIQDPEGWWDDCSSTILGVFTKLGMEKDKLSYLNQAKEDINNQIKDKEKEIEILRKENSSLQTAINHVENTLLNCTDKQSEKSLKKERKRLIKQRDSNFFGIKVYKQEIDKLKSKTDDKILDEYLISNKIYYEDFPVNVSQETVY